MSNYSSEITAWYEAIQYRAPPTDELASFEAQLSANIITTAQAVAQIEASFYTQNYVDPVIREYQAAFGRVPDQAGAAYWVGQVAANPANLAQLSTAFANSAEFFADYAASATTPASSTLVTALYANVLGRAPDAAGLAYWSNSGLDAAQLLQSFAQSQEFITDTTPYVIAFQNAEVAGNPPTSGSIYNQVTAPIAANTYTITYGAPTTYSITATLGGQTVTGTIAGGPTGPISSTEAAGNSNVVINASLGLNNSQSIVFNGINNVLNADYTPGVGPVQSLTNSTFPTSNFDQVGLNIQGVQTWNIDAEVPYSSSSSSSSNTITFTGDAPGGHVITGLQTVNFNDNSGTTSLIIGNNSEPVDPTTPANGFTINVSNAVGTGTNGVDVDIAAQEFTGKDTINVGADVVGGFPLDSGGSYIFPLPFETGASNLDKDDYNPNWAGFEGDAFAISAGASAGPNGSIGFQNWVISSTGAKGVGSMNILALGGEGSTTAQTITLTDDGSPTMLFASAISDSLSTDWENVTTINLAGTSGNVVITGAETDAQNGGWTSEGGGLLTSDTTALTSITGGAGNSFYDLSSLTLAAAHAATEIQGGTSHNGNSEVAFNNSVVASVSTANPLGLTVNIQNIQVLDDTGYLPTGATFNNVQGESNTLQGGTINMADFAGLQALNTNYDLLSGPLGNLFYVKGGSLQQNATFAAGNDVAPAGFQLLQLLDTDGSTQATLAQNLTILNGFEQFAINMQDVADGFIVDHYGKTSTTLTVHSGWGQGWGGEGNGPGPLNFPDLIPGGGGLDGGTIVGFGEGTSIADALGSSTLSGYNITVIEQQPYLVSTVDTLDLWVSDDGITVYQNLWEPTGSSYGWVETPVFTLFNSPYVTIDNYTTVNIFLPAESVNNTYFDEGRHQHTENTPNYVVLGSADPILASGADLPGFVDQPVVSVPVPGGSATVAASVNFYDNTVDNGGSPGALPDNLVLGYTNFTAHLTVADIGVTSVFIDATTPTTTINDFGAGSFEIGATNATNLNAQSTSHLIMDLPGVPDYLATNGYGPATGITVNGSQNGQNLIQGSSGTLSVVNDGFHFGYYSPDGYVYSGVVGNDTLTGGAFGDNYFPEGGNDTINLAHSTAKGAANSTIWFAEYDVSSIVGADGTVLPHIIYEQAITEYNGAFPGGGYNPETWVDGYGTDVLTINNFVLGSSTNPGDLINIDPSDWAIGPGLKGLVETDGQTQILHHTAPDFVQVGTANTALTAKADIILDGISDYANASQLESALLNYAGGNIVLYGTGVAKYSQVDILVAYSTGSSIKIADVTLDNDTNHSIVDTSLFHGSAGSIQVHDLITLTGQGTSLALEPTNIHFI